jgi:hypothetical protein
MTNFKKKSHPTKRGRKPGWQMSLEKRQEDRGIRHNEKILIDEEEHEDEEEE